MSILKKLFNFIPAGSTKFQDVLLLVLRISVGVVFFMSGKGKFEHLDHTVQFFASLNIPFPFFNTVLAAGTELVGGLLLIVGALTRLISLPLAFVMVVAIVTAKLGEVANWTDFLGLVEWLYLLIFLLFVAMGAGRYSLDRWIQKKIK